MLPCWTFVRFWFVHIFLVIFLLLYFFRNASCFETKREHARILFGRNSQYIEDVTNYSSASFSSSNLINKFLSQAFEQAPSLSTMIILNDDQKKSFIRDGFLVIPQVVSEELVAAALEVTDTAVEKGQYNKKPPTEGSSHSKLDFWSSVKSDPAVMNLLHKSGLFQIVEQLLGEGNAVIMNDTSQVAYTQTADIYVEEGMHFRKPHKKWCWHVDKPFGDYQARGADFLLLAGVALSEGQEIDQNRGQLNVWPGSHYLNHKKMREAVRTGPPDQVHQNFKANKPNCGDPMRVLLAKGDVVLAHQRLAHCPGVNLYEKTRKNIYFRILNKNHDDILEAFTESDTPWIGFEGIRDLVTEDDMTLAE